MMNNELIVASGLCEILEVDPAGVILKRYRKQNKVFNWPREQYAKLDRGDIPDPINARYLTLTNQTVTDPALMTVPNESLRVEQTTKAADPNNPRGSIFRFILRPGQFVGTFSNAVLIGSPSATSTPGTGRIICAVTNILDDLGNPIVRDATTIHIVQWNLRHFDVTEV